MMKFDTRKMIHEAISIYRKNFKLFLMLSLHSSGWLLISNISGILVISGLAYIMFLSFHEYFMSILAIPSRHPNFPVSVIIFLTTLAVILSVFSSAQGRLSEATIGQITCRYMLGNPEKSSEIFLQIRPQLWQFWIAQFLIDTRLSSIGLLSSRFDGMIFIMIGIMLQLWLFSRWFISSIIISNEGCSAKASLRMSAKKISPHVFQISLVVIFACFLVSPFYILALLPVSMFWFTEYQNLSSGAFPLDPTIHFLQSLCWSVFLLTIINIAVAPFWQSLKATLYYRLKQTN
jgi:hypothetical protein